MLNVARGPLVVDADLQAALDSGKVAGAALDVFQSEPITEHPLFGYPNVIVTPHLGASTAEANDRAGFQAAEQIVAALTGGSVTTAVNIPAIPEEDLEALTPFVPLARALGKIAASLVEDAADRHGAGRSSSAASPSATRRLLGLNVLMGVLAAQGAEDLNEVNAPALAEQRGISTTESKQADARDYTDLIRVTVTSGEQHRQRRRHRDRQPAPAAPARDLGPALPGPARGARHDVPLPRPPGHARARRHAVRRQQRQHRVRGRRPPARRGAGDEEPLAAMIVTTDAPVPDALVQEIATSDGFVAGVTVTL